MSEWFDTTLGQVAEIRVSNVDKKQLPGERSVRLCNYMDVYAATAVETSEGLMRATASDAEVLKFGLKAGDVVITKDSESPDDIAVPAYVPSDLGDDVVCGYHLAILRPVEAVDGLFLSYLLRLPQVNQHFAQRATGSTRYGLTLDAVQSAPLRIPRDLKAQRRLGELLAAIDRRIAGSRALAHKYKKLRAGLFGKLRDVDCAYEAIGDGFDLQAGTTPLRSQARFYDSEGTPWVKTLDLNDSLLYDSQERVSAAALEACSLRVHPPGTVLVAMYGGWEQIGRTSLLEISACTNQAITALLAKRPGEWDSYFVLKALQALRHKWADFAVSTRKDPNITKSDIAAFRLPRLALAGQLEWAARIRAVDSALVDEHEVAAKLELQKQGLMQELLWGPGRQRMGSSSTAGRRCAPGGA
ncbi:restriction endonuclease subunit S [Variovorax guangxiensis]|nr:restriction endonuclease subunit S [Variovorax guangxiensis]